MPVLPSFELRDQVALVTGAARGLGRAIALALAAAGADVALGLRDASADGGVAAEIEALGRRALPLQMDLAVPGQIGPAVDAAVAGFGRLDILVNNAGIAPQNPAEDVREEDLDATLAVNLKGTFLTSQAAGRVMIAQRSGRIISIGSPIRWRAAIRSTTSASNAGSARSALVPSVRMNVGATALTVIPWPPHSTARHFVRCETAAFDRQ